MGVTNQLNAKYNHIKGQQVQNGKISARRTLSFFFRATDFKCTHCMSEARILGLMQRTEDASELRRLVNVKLMLSLLYRSMRMWIGDVHAKQLLRLPRVIFKFIPYKSFSNAHRTVENMHRAFEECGDVQWLEGHRHIAVIGIFFVFDEDGEAANENNDDDGHAPEYLYDAGCVNEVLNRIWRDNYTLHVNRCKAKTRTDFRGSQQLSMVEADNYNVLCGNIDGSGYELDRPNGQDMSEIPNNAMDIFNVLQQFNRIPPVPSN
eukprot:gene245-430_t